MEAISNKRPITDCSGRLLDCEDPHVNNAARAHSTLSRRTAIAADKQFSINAAGGSHNLQFPYLTEPRMR